MKGALLVSSIVLGLLAVLPGSATAAGIRPARFAISQSYLPQPAEIVTSRVEPNDLVATDDVVRSQAAALVSLGRITGYFKRGAQPNDDASGHPHPVVTSYLVSVFGTAQEANSAFLQHRDALLRASQNPAPGTAVAAAKYGSIPTVTAGWIAAFTFVTHAGENSTTTFELSFAVRSELV